MSGAELDHSRTLYQRLSSRGQDELTKYRHSLPCHVPGLIMLRRRRLFGELCGAGSAHHHLIGERGGGARVLVCYNDEFVQLSSAVDRRTVSPRRRRV